MANENVEEISARRYPSLSGASRKASAVETPVLSAVEAQLRVLSKAPSTTGFRCRSKPPLREYVLLDRFLIRRASLAHLKVHVLDPVFQQVFQAVSFQAAWIIRIKEDRLAQHNILRLVDCDWVEA